MEAGPCAQAGLGCLCEYQNNIPRTNEEAPDFQLEVKCGTFPILEVLVTESTLWLAGWRGCWNSGGVSRRLTPGGSELPRGRDAGKAMSLWGGQPGVSRSVSTKGNPKSSCLLPPLGLGRGPGGLLGPAPPVSDAQRRGLCVSQARHNARLTLPSSVIEIHCQIY